MRRWLLLERAAIGQSDLRAYTTAHVRQSELCDHGETMTTLDNRPNTALLVVDVQNGVVGGAYARDTVVANVATIVEKARAAGVPVVWVQHSSDSLAQGSEQWQIVPELSPEESEPLVEKRYPDSFEATTLESRPGRPRRRQPGRRRRADGRMRPLDAARRPRSRL